MRREASRRGAACVHQPGVSRVRGGERVPTSLSVCPHICPCCGLVMDRDEHAATNMYRAGQARQGAVALAAMMN